MNIVFWQNIVSPHQLPYIKKLINESNVDSVTLVAAEDISIDRKQMGWENGSVNENSVRIILAKNNRIDEDTAKVLLSRDPENSIHLFSGITAFEFCLYYFKMSLNYKIKRGIISEGPLTFAYGIEGLKPIWLHKLKFILKERKYAPYIDYVFAIGTPAVKFFSSIYSNWKVVPFAYCTEPPINIEQDNNQRDNVRFLFVGSLSKRKSPTTIVNAIRKLKNYELTLIGEGSERKKIEETANSYNLGGGCTILNFQKQSIIHEKMSQHDVLILPSLHDGWGAVVNEALQVGLYVIVSDRCGAADLIKDDEKRGMVFKAGNTKDLANKMRQVIANIQTIRANRIYRAKWAEQHISPEAIAHYMIECLTK